MPGSPSDGSFKAAYEACTQGLSELVKSAQEQVVRHLPEDEAGVAQDRGALAMRIKGADPAARKAAQARVETLDVFENLLRKATALAETLSEADREAHRKAVKAQETLFRVKLESSRTASAVNLQNAQAEMQAQYHRELEDREKSLKSGGSSALADVHRQLEAATERIVELEKDVKKQSGVNSSLRGILAVHETQEADAHTKALQAAALVERLQAELAELQRKGHDKGAVTGPIALASSGQLEFDKRLAELEVRLRAEAKAAEPRLQAEAAAQIGAAAERHERAMAEALLRFETLLAEAKQREAQLTSELEHATNLSLSHASPLPVAGDEDTVIEAAVRNATLTAQRKFAAEKSQHEVEIIALRRELTAMSANLERALRKVDGSTRRLIESRAKTASSLRGAAQYDDAEYKRRVQHLAVELEMQVCDCATDGTDGCATLMGSLTASACATLMSSLTASALQWARTVPRL